VVFVTVQFPPWGGGGVLRLTKLVKHLVPLGWKVAVIASDEVHPEVVDESLAAEVPVSVSVLRVRGPFRTLGGAAKAAAAKGSDRGLLGRLGAVGKVAARALLIPDRWLGWALRVGRMSPVSLPTASVVVSSGPPHSAHLGASLLARRLKVPHVVDLRDDWGENPLHTNPAPWHRPIERLLERWCLGRAAYVVCAADAGVPPLLARLPGLTDRIVSIPNGYDPDDLKPLPARTASSPGAQVHFIYAGSLRGSQVVGCFFDAFGDICREDPGSFHLELVGLISAHHGAAIRAAVPQSALDTLGPVSHQRALERMASSDVLVLFTGGGGWGSATMTGKLYEYLALRRPILLVGPPGPAAELVLSSRSGAVAPPENPALVREAILKSVEQARDPSFMGAPASLLQTFDRRAQARDWSELLLEVRARAEASR
jgi:glycosyltransferase involved in cell wall biosynthesis